MRARWLMAMGWLAVCGPRLASAQWDPEGGDTGTPPPGWGQQQPPQQPQQGGWGQQPQQGTGAGWTQQGSGWGRGDVERPPRGDDEPQQEQGDSSSDHAAVIGRIGLGWFGVTNIPIGAEASADPSDLLTATVEAPSVGVRFWFSERLGLDIALGLGFINAGFTGGETGRGPSGTWWGFAGHVGLPIALYHAKHYKLLVTPGLSIGASGAAVPSPEAIDSDDLLGGFLLRLGGRAGAEIHFGFIDVPELTIEGSIGLVLEHANRNGNYCADADCDATIEISTSSLRISTFLSEEPWDLFTGNIRARYYF